MNFKAAREMKKSTTAVKRKGLEDVRRK